MSLEAGGPDKKKRSGTLEAAALAATLLTFEGGPAYGLDIPEFASWNAAIQRNVRNAVMNDPHESAAVYVKYSDKKNAWPSIAAGEKTRVVYDVNNEMRYLHQNIRGRSIEVRCQLHTHLAQRYNQGGVTKIVPFNPPSAKDVSFENARWEQTLTRHYNVTGLPLQQNILAAVDVSGIWYYKPSTAASISDDAVKAWRVVFTKFVHDSALEPSFDFSRRFQELRQAYRVHLSADVRFDSYADVAQRPACAGVDHVPDTSVAHRLPEKSAPASARPSLAEADQPKTRPHLPK